MTATAILSSRLCPRGCLLIDPHPSAGGHDKTHSPLPHGERNPLPLHHATDLNFDSPPARYGTVRRSLTIQTEGLDRNEKKKRTLAAVAAMREELGIATRLGDLGVTKADLPKLAATAIRDPCLATNPRRATVHDIVQIYEKAL